ncbi:MAG: recombinase family protein [Lachnospiraceae bacterium]|jgi:DNA invertase Pin-like site-specific DNA recombinase|nr:recombinase family protein [Lachnospiraceae bacterium]
MKENLKNQKHFLAAMYLRLSRDDNATKGSSITKGENVAKRGNTAGITGVKSESNSITSQRELIRAYIQRQPDIELYDIYVDDGFSGSNFERPEFKRMMDDVEAGRVNCIIVKDLSRFGRDYIESGRYIQRIFPALGVRFIALTDHFDSLCADVGESGIVLPVKNFINDSYCRDISMKVKSQLAVKRKAGEYLAAFAVYGYRKSAEDKNRLTIDDYAAEIVRRIFEWKISGMAMAAIAEKLNALHVLSPREYKKSLGLNYRGGFSGGGEAKWSSSAVKRILTNEVYVGHLLQGKTEKINYKIKKNVEKPKEEWIRVENTHEPIISTSDFEIVQNLLRADGRISPEKGEVSPFMGLLFCGDCGEQMVRRTSRYRDSCKIYYICSTKNRGEGCSRHSIEESRLAELVETAVCSYVNALLQQEKLFQKARGQEANLEAVIGCQREMTRLRGERDKYLKLCKSLHEDLQQGIVTKEEFERLYGEFWRKAERLGQAQEMQEELIRKMFQSGVSCAGRLTEFRDTLKLGKVDRHTLVSLVKRIHVYEKKRIRIDFYFQDEYQIMQDYTESGRQENEEGRGA